MKEPIVYNIYGLSRSGNHAITFWILHNLSEKYQEIGNQSYASIDNKVCYLNNVGKMHHKEINESLYDIVVKSWEDINYVDDNDIVIHRDFLNLLCSKFKAFNLFLHPIPKKYGGTEYSRFNNSMCVVYEEKFLDILKNIITVWKQHCGARNLIKYNLWLKSHEYRNNIADMVGIPNIVDNIKYISKIGGGSSFGGLKLFDYNDYTSRYREVKLPDEFIEHILDDKELIQLNIDLYDINLTKII